MLRKFILCSLISLSFIVIAGCAGETREKREPANALLLEGLMAGAMADCGNRLEAGEFATHVERARCEGVEARGSVEGLGMEYAFGDLIALMSEWRLRLARERDARTLDTAGERARQKQFDAAFLREMDTRERLHNSGVRAIEFNVCDIEGNGLSCTAQTPTNQIEKQYDTWGSDCDRKEDFGYLKNLESFNRCVFEEGLVPIYERAGFPHIGLVKLYASYIVDLGRRYDVGQLTQSKVLRNAKILSEQYDAEVRARDNLRAAGNLNWRQRECRIEVEQLICVNAPASR